MRCCRFDLRLLQINIKLLLLCKNLYEWKFLTFLLALVPLGWTEDTSLKEGVCLLWIIVIVAQEELPDPRTMVDTRGTGGFHALQSHLHAAVGVLDQEHRHQKPAQVHGRRI